MKEMKHTPEPWRTVELKAPTSPDQMADRLIASSDNQHVAETFQYRNHNNTDEETALANAHRIVACVNGCEGIVNPPAVPELLAAGKAVEEAYGCECVNEDKHCPMCLLRAAIAKVRGE